MSNKRNRKTSKTLTQDQCALLMLVKTKPFVGKPLGQPVAKTQYKHPRQTPALHGHT
jgi:hypothetical protein